MTTGTRPGTAYEACERAAADLEAHPLNYYQDCFACHRDGPLAGRASLPEALDVPENECGTSFCRAGWIVGAAYGHDALKAMGSGSIERAALRILGARYGSGEFRDDAVQLFAGGALNRHDGPLVPGTPEYAKAGAEGIRAFMARHEARLRATPLPEEGP